MAIGCWKKGSTLKAIEYIRHSNKKQEEGASIEMQQESIEGHCSRKGLDLVETFIDKGFSASTGDHITHGKFGTVILPAVDAGKYRGYALVVHMEDRFSRLGMEMDWSLMTRLFAGGVELHISSSGKVYKDFNDLGDTIQKLIGSYTAKDYSDKLSVRITAGKGARKDQAENEGWILSRSVPAWLQVVGRENIGNKITNPGKIEVIPEMVEVVREAYRMASLGMGRTVIFRKLNGRLNGLSMTWLTRVLCDRSVLGYFKQEGREEIPNYFPAIIDQQLYNEVRRQAEAKRKGGRSAGGNRQHSDRADDLLQGLVYDEDRPMYYQPVNNYRYFTSAIKGERKINRIRYEKVATKVVMMLEREDWLAIRGMSESAEYLAAKAELEATLSQLDKTQNHLNLMNSYMEGDNTDKIEIAMRFIKKDETTIAALEARKDELQATLEAATKRSAALYQDEELRAIIREVKANPAMRMRLRTEIQKRVSRIELRFTPDKIRGVIRYVNGAEGKEFTIE
jgi:hypothetical protein